MFTYYIKNTDNGKTHNCGHTLKAFKRAYNTAKAADVPVSGFRVHMVSSTCWDTKAVYRNGKFEAFEEA